MCATFLFFDLYYISLYSLVLYYKPVFDRIY